MAAGNQGVSIDKIAESAPEPGRAAGDGNGKRPRRGFWGRALNVVLIGTLAATTCLGFGLYAQTKYEQEVAKNPAIQMIDALSEIGKGVSEGLEKLVGDISSFGFFPAVGKYVDENLTVPYNTTVPVYGNTAFEIPINEVKVVTSRYLVLSIDSATNKLFNNLFKVVPETILQNNGKKDLVVYELDESVNPPKVEEKLLKPDETITIQGVAIEAQPGINTGEIVAARQQDAIAYYELSVAYSKPEGMTVEPLKKGASLNELRSFLLSLGEKGIEYELSPALSYIELDTSLSLSLPMPPVTVNTVPISSSRYKSEVLNTVDDITQQMWPIQPINSLGDFLRWLSNMQGITKAFQQMYLNVPAWTAQAKAMPGNENLPDAVLPTISESTEDLSELPMPSYFPGLWKDTTQEGITDIYLELLKLTINAGVNPPTECSSNMEILRPFLLEDPSADGLTDDYRIGVIPDCVIKEKAVLTVSVPAQYVQELQDKADSYLDGMRKADASAAGGIDYSGLEITVIAGP